MGCKQAWEQKIRRKAGGRNAQFTAAEKNGKGMALKSFTGAKPFLKARMSHVDAEMEMRTCSANVLIFCRNGDRIAGGKAESRGIT